MVGVVTGLELGSDGKPEDGSCNADALARELASRAEDVRVARAVLRRALPAAISDFEGPGSADPEHIATLCGVLRVHRTKLAAINAEAEAAAKKSCSSKVSSGAADDAGTSGAARGTALRRPSTRWGIATLLESAIMS